MPEPSQPSPAVAPTKPPNVTNEPEAKIKAAPSATEQPLPNIPTGIFYINYFDEITDGKVRGLMALCADILAKVKPTPTTFYFAISSPVEL